MNINKIHLLTVIVIAVMLVWLIVKSIQPGGTLIPLFVLLVILCLISSYYGFINKAYNPFRYLSKAGTVVFFFLALFMAYYIRLNDQGVERLSSYIEVYPNISEINVIPRVSQETVEHWVIKTQDSVSEVAEFYANRKNMGNWTVTSSQPHLLLEKKDLKLSISFQQEPFSSNTNIFYHIKHR